jgi:hypothetical protein
MDDLGRYIAKGGTFKLAASAEFMERTAAMVYRDRRDRWSRYSRVVWNDQNFP